MSATEPIRDKRQLQKLAEYWLKRGNLRNYTLIVVGSCTALRVSDLLRLKWEDVYDETCGAFRSHITVTVKIKRQSAGYRHGVSSAPPPRAVNLTRPAVRFVDIPVGYSAEVARFCGESGHGEYPHNHNDCQQDSQQSACFCFHK